MASSLEALLGQIRKLQQGAPYDPSLATALQNAQYQMSDLDRSYDKGRQSVQSMYDEGVRNLGQQRDTNVKNTMGLFADRGTLHSGIHANAQGEVEQDYQTGLTDAAQRRLAGFTSLDEGRRSAESGIQQMLVGAQEDYSRRQAEAAQARANQQAQREAAAAQAAQQAAMQRQMIAAINAQNTGGGGGVPTAPAGPRTGRADAGMMGSTFTVMHPEDFDTGFENAMRAYGTAGGLNWIQNHQRYGGYTEEQRKLMSAAQRRTRMVSRRNQ